MWDMGIERVWHGDRKGMAWGYKGWDMGIERMWHGDRKGGVW